MSLDDLITLLLVVLFVGAPLLQRLLRGGAGPQQPGEGGEADREQSETARGEGRSAQADSAEPDGRTARADREASSEGASELQKRLEEARRRVREAREGKQPGSASAPSKAPQSAAPPARFDRQPAPSRPLVAARESGASTGFLGREGATRQPTKKTAPLQVSKRKRKGKGSTLSRKRVLSLDSHSVLQGIVWHQILSERKGKRVSRRQPSRDR